MTHYAKKRQNLQRFRLLAKKYETGFFTRDYWSNFFYGSPYRKEYLDEVQNECMESELLLSIGVWRYLHDLKLAGANENFSVK